MGDFLPLLFDPVFTVHFVLSKQSIIMEPKLKKYSLNAMSPKELGETKILIL